MSIQCADRIRRGEKSLSFVQQGTFVRQAQQLRSDRAERLVPLKREAAVPDVEWWDVEYLSEDVKSAVDDLGNIRAVARRQNPDIVITYSAMKLSHCETMDVQEHPCRVHMKRKSGPEAVPLMLTAKERKRVRRQHRAEREKEKQDKVALGLMPPPKDKVKLSNMMRVLQSEAIADPSAVEKRVREEVAERQKEHEMANLAKKLTPEEKRAKTIKKIKKDAAEELQVALFRVPDMADPRLRFKVDVNAQQWHLTGALVLCESELFNLVVAEGGPKAIKGYTKLMTRRIKWPEEQCHLVWTVISCAL